MILMRLAISIFGLAMLGMAFSMSAAQSQQENHAAPLAVTLQQG